MTSYADNIIMVYERASDLEREEGATWYADARTLAAALAGAHWHNTSARTINAAAAVIAAASQNQGWEINVQIALRTFRQGRCNGGTYDTVCSKINRILDGENPLDVLGGRKVRAFHACIVSAGQTNTVTIDRHATSIALGRVPSDRERNNLLARKGGYDSFADGYREATAWINATYGTSYTPAQVQAITWLRWRHELEGRAPLFGYSPAREATKEVER